MSEHTYYPASLDEAIDYVLWSGEKPMCDYVGNPDVQRYMATEIATAAFSEGTDFEQAFRGKLNSNQLMYEAHWGQVKHPAIDHIDG